MNKPVNKPIYELLVLAGSAGSLDSLLEIISALNNNTLAIIIVVHRKDDNDSVLVTLMASRTAMYVKEAEDKEAIIPGTVYIAPPDYHLLVENNRTLSLDVSEKLHFSRPCIDVTLETAAEAFRDKIIAVLLSGANKDGASGMQKVMETGGTGIVQDPSTADVPYMPQHALSEMTPSHIVKAAELPGFINKIVNGFEL